MEGWSRCASYALYILVFLQLGLSKAQGTEAGAITYADKNVTVGSLDVKFRSEPRGRGTMGIVLSCIATFLFCIWGTVHPNITAGAKSYYRLFYKAVLMLIAIVVPEGLILCAFSQFRQARELNNLWLEKHSDEKESFFAFLKFWTDSEATFGMDVAFFVVMGGFVVKPKAAEKLRPVEQQNTPSSNRDIEGADGEEVRHTDPQGITGDKTPLVNSQETKEGPEMIILTADGFKQCLEQGYINKKNMKGLRAAILDKGKTSNMGKFLAGLQALWFLVQCVARWQARLPVSLLEIHVAIQVICTMIIFFCWWSKPLDVNHNMEIEIDPEDPHRKVTRDQKDIYSEIVELQSEETKLVNRFKTLEAVNPKFPASQRFIRKKTPPDLTGITSKAFYDISECLDRHDKGHWKAMTAEAFLVFLTGALHAAAWNYPFARQLGRVLWRYSSIGMCIFPTFAVFIAYFTGYQTDLATITWEIHLGRPGGGAKRHLLGVTEAMFKQIYRAAYRHGHLIGEGGRRDRSNHVRGVFMTIFHLSLMWFVILLLVAYAVSIITITIISFISLTSLPVGSFNTPRWNDYWPHF